MDQELDDRCEKSIKETIERFDAKLKAIDRFFFYSGLGSVVLLSLLAFCF